MSILGRGASIFCGPVRTEERSGPKDRLPGAPSIGASLLELAGGRSRRESRPIWRRWKCMNWGGTQQGERAQCEGRLPDVPSIEASLLELAWDRSRRDPISAYLAVHEVHELGEGLPPEVMHLMRCQIGLEPHLKLEGGQRTHCRRNGTVSPPGGQAT